MTKPAATPASPDGFLTRLGLTFCGYLKGVRLSVLSVHVRGKVRRLFQGTFRPGYVRRQLLLRRGQCLQCGRCCQLAYVCPALDCRNRLCLVYRGYRPKNCRIFPVNAQDLADVEAAGGTCGFRFVSDAEASATTPPVRGPAPKA